MHAASETHRPLCRSIADLAMLRTRLQPVPQSDEGSLGSAVAERIRDRTAALRLRRQPTRVAQWTGAEADLWLVALMASADRRSQALGQSRAAHQPSTASSYPVHQEGCRGADSQPEPGGAAVGDESDRLNQLADICLFPAEPALAAEPTPGLLGVAAASLPGWMAIKHDDALDLMLPSEIVEQIQPRVAMRAGHR